MQCIELLRTSYSTLWSLGDYEPYFFGLGAVCKSTHSLHLRPPVPREGFVSVFFQT